MIARTSMIEYYLNKGRYCICIVYMYLSLLSVCSLYLNNVANYYHQSFDMKLIMIY